MLDTEGIIDELGHSTTRCPEQKGVWINGMVSPSQATRADFVLLGLNGKKLAGNEPASKILLHLAI